MMFKGAQATRQGFTLIEMAVVLAIIGLLAGGVVAGQALIARSRITGIMNDLGKYKTAYDKFRLQYAAIPGDYLDATERWGTDPDGCPTHTNRVPKKETCNGNGNNHIGDSSGTSDSNELFRAWQHLADAGFIDGTFSGVAAAGSTYDATPGLNVPAGSLANSGFTLLWYDVTAGNAFLYAGNYGQSLLFGMDMTSHYTYGPQLTPRQAKNLDDKMDDGKPGLGGLLTYPSGTNPSCTTSDTAASAAYNLTNKGSLCSFIYILRD